MKKAIVNPNKVNHKVYIRLLVLFFITLFVSFGIPKETNDFCNNVADIVRNLSYGCVASTVVAWLIDCANVRSLNQKADAIYEAVYLELKLCIAVYIGTWAECCAVLYKEQDYYSIKKTWLQWYDVFKEEFHKMEEESQAKAMEFLTRQLLWSVQRVRASMEHIQSQNYMLTINDVMNSKMKNILEDFKFEFTALEWRLEEVGKTEEFFSYMDAITGDLKKYIDAWVDIKEYNEVWFRPYKFTEDYIEKMK